MISKRITAFAALFALLVALPLTVAPAGARGVSIAVADINGDNVVDSADRDLLFADWGAQDTITDIFQGNPAESPTSNGVVDVDDLNVIQSFFGQSVVRGDVQIGFTIFGVDLGGDPIASDALKGSPVVTDSANGFYIDPLASGVGSGNYQPLGALLSTFPTLEYTSYVNFGEGPSAVGFTPNGPDFSTPGFSVDDGHFDTAGEARGAWYTNDGEPSTTIAGGGEGVHVARLSVDRGETLDTGDAVLRVLVDTGFVSIQTVRLPLNGGPVFGDEFGNNLPIALEAFSVLAAQPDDINGRNLDVYDIYVGVGTAIFVDAGGKGDFSDIQSAIDSAVNGDVIIVGQGSYSPFNFNGKAVTVRSFNPNDPFDVSNTIVNAFQKETCVTFENGEGNDAILDGLTITNGDSNQGGGIFISGAGPTIRNCNIQDNDASQGGGIFLEDAFLTVIENCTFTTNSASNNGGAISITDFSDDVLISGCNFASNTVSGGVGQEGGAIAILSGQATIVEFSTFVSNQANDGGAIYNSNSPDASFTLVDNCTFTLNIAGRGGALMATGPGLDCLGSAFASNTATNQGGGAYLQNSSRVINCIFEDNMAAGQGGAAFLFSDQSEVANCTIVDNDASVAGGGVYHQDADAIVSNSIITGNTPNQIASASVSNSVFYNLVEGGFPGLGNIDADPLFVDASNSNYRLMSGSPAIDAGANTLFPAGLTMDFDGEPRFVDDPEVADTGDGTAPIIDLGAFESQGQMVLTVDDSGGADFLTIQDAIDAALTGGIVEVNDGTYVEVINFNGKDITVRSVNGPSFTTINGDMMGSVVVFDSGETPDAILEGFTITNGLSSSGGGVFISASDPVINNCVITSNVAALRGAGVFIESGANPEISDSVISMNDAGETGQGGGIHIESAASLTIVSSTISGNTAERGGGLLCNMTGSSITAIGCLFQDNEAISFGGAVNHGNATGNYTNCRFINNSAPDGGGAAWNYFISSGTITNCLAYDNSGADGGALRAIDSSDVTVVNTTFTENSASNGGGGAFIDLATDATFLNCVFWDNGDEILVNDVDSNLTVEFSLVDGGGIDGSGNIDADPLFANPSGDDFTLGVNSPAIDAGANGAVPGGTTTDLEGNIRFFDDTGTPDTGDGTAPIVDMGAFEFQGMSFTDCDGNGVDDDLDLMPDLELNAFPMALDNNTTGGDDSTFTDIPDGVAFALGNASVTYVFSGFRLIDGPGQDFNVYELDFGDPEFDMINVLVSEDGTNFFSVNATQAPAVSIDGDDAHGDAAFRRSYDLGFSGLSEARFVRIVGTASAPPGGTEGFELDAIGLANVRALDANENGVLDDCEVGTIFVDANADGTGDGLSWGNAYTDLQAAIDFAEVQPEDGIDIFVAQGVYVPSGSVDVLGFDFTATFTLPNGANLIGGFSGDGTETNPSQADPANNPTILSGDTLGDDAAGFMNRDDNRYHVVTVENGAIATIEGFTIRGGNAVGAGNDAVGGAVFSIGGSITMTNCIVEDNLAMLSGGGVALMPTDVRGAGAASSFEGCLFTGNLCQSEEGGAIYADGRSLSVDSSIFSNNQSSSGDGGAISIRSSSLTVTSTDFVANTADNGLGGAILATDAGVSIESCLFDSSAANSGGAILAEDSGVDITLTEFSSNTSAFDGGAIWFASGSNVLLATSCVFTNNSTDSDGGAAWITDSIETVLGGVSVPIGVFNQCTFVGNNADSDGAAIYAENFLNPVAIAQSSFADNGVATNTVFTDGDLFVFNSILWDNGTSQDITTFGEGSNLEYSIIESFLTGEDFRGGFESVLSVDPRFVDVSSGNLDLMPGSPAIDAGDSQDPSQPELDILGRQRLRDDTGTPDTGIPANGETGPVIDMGAFEFQGTTSQPDFFPFGEAVDFSTSEIITDLSFSDLDRDGDLDIISTLSGKSDVLQWFEATSADFDGSTRRNIDFLTHPPVAFSAADMNNDGDTDIVLLTTQEISIYNNSGVATPGFTQFDVITGLTDGQSIATGDIDRDGDIDILAGFDGANGLRWYENTATSGMAAFDPHTVLTSSGDFKAVALADMDRDGDLDAIGADNGGSVLLGRNSGFGASFSQSTIDSGYDEVVGLVVADFNNDAAPDLAYAVALPDPMRNGFDVATVIVALNNGSGTGFSTSQAGDDVGNVRDLDVADIDQDGDMDIIVATAIGTVDWLENLGNGSFMNRSAFIAADENITHLAIGDAAPDGRLSLAVGSVNQEFSGVHRFVPNALIHRATDFPTGRVLAREGNGITTTTSGDIDGDGDIDLVTGSFFDDEILWYENPGDTTSLWAVHSLSDASGNTSSDAPTRVHTVDFDRDGDLDIASTSILDGAVTIWLNAINENAGDPTAFDAVDIIIGESGAFDVDSGDFDRDGRTDLAYVATSSNTIRIARNVGIGAELGSPTQIINVSTTATGVRAIAPADVDRDGDLDLFASITGAGTVSWYENNGDATAWTETVISTFSVAPSDVATGDFDNDGDLDIAVVDSTDNALFVYENSANGTSWPRTNVSFDLNGATAVCTGDFNADGFVDIAVASRFENSVRYFLNDAGLNRGIGVSFNEAEDSPVSTNAMSVQSIGAADIDGDGRVDLFAGSFAGDEALLYRNRGGQYTSTVSSDLEGGVFTGDTVQILDINITNLGQPNDPSVAFGELKLRLRNGQGAPMNAFTANAIFESISVSTSGFGNRGITAELGAIEDFSGISGGVISIPIDATNSLSFVEPQQFETFTVVVEIASTGAQAVPNGFRIELDATAGVVGVHAPSPDNILTQQNPPTFSTGQVSVQQSSVDLCLADCDQSGTVDFNDMVCTLFLFGNTDGIGDLDGSGVVDFNDIILILFSFGPCNN